MVFDSLLIFSLTVIVHSILLFIFIFKEASLKSGWESTYYDWIGMTVGFQSGNSGVCQGGGEVLYLLDLFMQPVMFFSIVS